MTTKISILILILASLACTSQANIATPMPAHKVKAIHTGKAPPISTPATQAIVSASRSVNIRLDATEHSRDIGDLYHAQIVYVTKCYSGWAWIRQGVDYPSGWVKADYLNGGICK